MDNSASSYKVIHYVAKLAHDTGSKIVLVAIGTAKKGLRIFAGHDHSPSESMNYLNDIHDLLTGTYHVPCEVLTTTISTREYTKLANLADHYDLTVIGVKKERDVIKESVYGMDLFQLIRASIVPLLIIPEDYPYIGVKRLLYAFDYSHEPVPPILQLRWLASLYNAEVRFISILPHTPDIREESKMYSIHNDILVLWQSPVKLSFETIVYKDVPKCLEHYWELWQQGDLIVLSVNHENALKSLWHKSVVKSLLSCAKHPFLILHK